MGRNAIPYFTYSRRMLFHQFAENRIRFIIYKDTARFDLIQKYPELFEIDIESGEDIDMVPGDPSQNGDMGEKKVEFGPFFQGACRIFIPLTDNDRGIGDVDGL